MTHIGRIAVLKEFEDDMQNICVCPHCGEKAIYGEMSTISGVHCCPKCNDELYETIQYDRKNRYNVYVKKANNNEYEPYKYEAIKGDPKHDN